MLRKNSPLVSPAPASAPGGGLRRQIRDPHWHAAFLFAAVGIGVAIHSALRWHELPHYSAADLEQSVQLNFAVDEARLAAHATITADQRQQLLARERTEVENDINQERQGIRAEFGLALVLLVLAIGQTVAARLNARRRAG
jgi:hypothetical protein